MSYIKERLGTISSMSVAIMLILLIAVSIIVSISIGVVDIPYGDVYSIVVNKFLVGLGNILNIDLGDPTVLEGVTYDIVWNLRSPRVFLAVVIGMTLAVAGVVMQATVQNPLADPYILGMSSGATLGATIFLALDSVVAAVSSIVGEAGIAVFAFIGSFVASIAVLALSSTGGRSNSVKLVLSGVIIASLFGAISNLIVVLAADADQLQALTFWTLGSFGGAEWDVIPIPLIALIISLIYFATQLRGLNTMLMGDDVATTLGVDLAKKRIIYVIFVSFMTATAVSFCGIIGFVGLMIPHVIRGLTGNNHWKLLPLSCLAGGLFMIWADVLSRSLLGGVEIPIGIITAICGAPIFAYIMIKKTYSFN